MMTQRKMSSGQSLAGRAAGRDGTAFHNAVLRKAGYRNREQKSIQAGTPIYSDDGRRRIKAGTLDKGIFTKHVKHEHILRKPPGIAVQESVLFQLRKLGCHTVRAELPDGVVLTAPLERFFSRGMRFDRGYGPQVALPMTQWDDVNTLQGVLAL